MESEYHRQNPSITDLPGTEQAASEQGAFPQRDEYYHGNDPGSEAYVLTFRWQNGRHIAEVVPNFLEMPDLEVIVNILFLLPRRFFVPSDARWIPAAFVSAATSKTPVAYRFTEQSGHSVLPAGLYAAFNRNVVRWERLAMQQKGLSYFRELEDLAVYRDHIVDSALDARKTSGMASGDL
ncbi:hypothetical protein [Chitinophaga rhizosphaerae]|uniref:hypothetical protein n=1 Tax=Chitinophaga rhizosphaerae TaxID=1864947 RepID=UPI000F800B7B|nr:hypothetical protein [Chitinophaga rhizosphaerae]